MPSLTLLAAALAAQTPTPQQQPTVPPQAGPTTPPPAGSPGTAVPQQVTPPPAFLQAAQTFGQCLGQHASTIPTTTTPEAGATQAIAACTAQRAALDAQFEQWIASPAFPPEGRDIARAQYAAQMASVPAQLSQGLAAKRAAPAPTPSPTPTPGK